MVAVDFTIRSTCASSHLSVQDNLSVAGSVPLSDLDTAVTTEVVNILGAVDAEWNTTTT